MRKFFIFICLCAYLPVCAQTILFKVSVDSVHCQGFKVFVKAMGALDRQEGKFERVGSCYQGTVTRASDGFYMLYGVNNNAQLLVPLYIENPSDECVLKLELDGVCPQVNLGKDNQALSAFNSVVYTQSRYMWSEGKNIPHERLLPLLKNYRLKADSIAMAYSCSEPVKEYLELWSSCQAYSEFESLPRISGIQVNDLPFNLSDIIPSPQEIYNHPMATYFYQTSGLVIRTLPDGSLTEKMDALYAKITNQQLRDDVTDVIISRFLRRHNYVDKFDEGLQELTEIVNKHSVSERYLEAYKVRRSTVHGASFPQGVRLSDALGNVMDFDSLKGGYVYIDLWASWCVPCRKEIPHLQKLEQEMAGKNIKFLSVSIDKRSADWKKALNQLKLHGLQWHDEGGKLADALNVKGIPFFLIYDKEGRLYQYNAPRPSSGAELKRLLENLE